MPLPDVTSVGGNGRSNGPADPAADGPDAVNELTKDKLTRTSTIIAERTRRPFILLISRDREIGGASSPVSKVGRIECVAACSRLRRTERMAGGGDFVGTELRRG